MFLRMKNYFLAACFCVVGLMPISGIVLGADVTVITEDYPPLNYVEDKQLKGPSVEIVRAIQKKLNNTDEIKVYPWARGYKYLETRINTALFSTTRTKAREHLFKWVGPLAEKKIGLFAKRGRNITLNTLEDAKKYLIGVQRGGNGMPYLAERGFKKFDSSTTPAANLRKLLAGRNDLWFASNATVAGNCKKLGIDVNEVELVLEVDNTFMAIAFNKDTPDATVNSWQAAYDGLIKDGTVKEIFKKHGLESLYPSFK